LITDDQLEAMDEEVGMEVFNAVREKPMGIRIRRWSRASRMSLPKAIPYEAEG